MKDFNFWKEEILNKRALIQNDDSELVRILAPIIFSRSHEQGDPGQYLYIGDSRVATYGREGCWLQFYSDELTSQFYSDELISKTIISASELYALYSSPETSIQLYPLT